MVPENLDFVCPRVRRLFEYFAKSPNALQHILLYGSPGSGKTSSTLWLLRQIWGYDNLFSRVCFILNAADERSLEAIRAKCIPFIEVDWREKGETRPRFLVLDECETLTESAQLALRPLLDHDPRQLCVIFLSNTLNRVHHSIRSACLRIRFNPPTPSSSLNSQFYRGDLRQLNQHKPTFSYIHKFLNQEPFNDFLIEEFVSACLFFLLSTNLFDETEYNFFTNYCCNQSFEYMSADQAAIVFKELYLGLQQKFDKLTWSEELLHTATK
jgi:hypothetical protein